MLLQKGLNFNATRNPLTALEVIPALEPVMSSLPGNIVNEVRLKLVNCLNKKVYQKENLNANEKKAIRSLQKDNSIYITKADKGNVIVVMKREDYEMKVSEHLNDGPYEKIKPRFKRTVLNKTMAQTTKLIRQLKPKLDIAVWFTLNPKSNLPPRFYALPKIHKPDVPIRPIIDFTNTPTYRLSKYLAHILKPLQKVTEFSIKNSYEFVEKLSKLRYEEDDVMVSFDAVSLFTSLPIDHCLEITKKLLNDDDSLSQRIHLRPTIFYKP